MSEQEFVCRNCNEISNTKFMIDVRKEFCSLGCAVEYEISKACEEVPNE